MEYPLEFSREGRSGQGKAAIGDDSLSISPESGPPMLIPLRDILEMAPADYKVTLTIPSGKLVLSSLGYKYEDFVRELCAKRSELILKDMLGNQKMVMGHVKAEYALAAGGGGSKGACEARVYETALVVMPERSDPLRMPFCEMTEARKEGFSIMVSGEYGEKLALSMMGRMLDPFMKALNDSMGALWLQAENILKDVAPGLGPDALQKAAGLMRDGVAARRKDLDGISPSIWAGLVKKLEAAGMGEQYSTLEGMSVKEQMCIGLKKGLSGDEYIWFLAPFREKGVMAMEATSEESGRATYLFRVEGKGEGALLEAIKTINRCMIAMNFRREPIYAEEDDPAYRFSIARLPQLRKLRSLFIKRVAHTEGWAQKLRGD
jgi:hypothetical protein